MTATATRIGLTFAAATLGGTLVAQQPRSLGSDEYAPFEYLTPARTPLSPDGRWLVYGVRRPNYQNDLRVQSSEGGTATTIEVGEQPAFSDDSRWLAYLVGFTEEQAAKLRKEKKPLRKKLGLLELGTGTTTIVDGIESFAWSPSGTHIAMRKYSDARDDAPPVPSPNSETVAPGTTLIVRELATGRDTTFGWVSEIAWQDKGTRLAFAVTIENGVGNGLQLYDTATGALRVLDSSTSTYGGGAVARQAVGGRIRTSVAARDRQQRQPRRVARRAGLASEGCDRDAAPESGCPSRPRAVDAGGVVDGRRPLHSHRPGDWRRSHAGQTQRASPGR